jgi:hypothetical protein
LVCFVFNFFFVYGRVNPPTPLQSLSLPPPPPPPPLTERGIFILFFVSSLTSSAALCISSQAAMGASFGNAGRFCPTVTSSYPIPNPSVISKVLGCFLSFLHHSVEYGAGEGRKGEIESGRCCTQSMHAWVMRGAYKVT